MGYSEEMKELRKLHRKLARARPEKLLSPLDFGVTIESSYVFLPFNLPKGLKIEPSKKLLGCIYPYKLYYFNMTYYLLKGKRISHRSTLFGNLYCFDNIQKALYELDNYFGYNRTTLENINIRKTAIATVVRVKSIKDLEDNKYKEVITIPVYVYVANPDSKSIEKQYNNPKNRVKVNGLKEIFE